MTFTREQKKEAYKKLSPEVQDFIMDNETTEIIGSFLKESGLSDEQFDYADSEILYAMFGLQTLTVAIDNIAKLSNKNRDELSGLKENLENSIFDKIVALGGNKNKIQVESAEIQPGQNPPQNNVGSDFEQIILNQARAMQPAIPPENLPTSPEPQPKAINDYKSGDDPYREPIL
jgi:hypothetical protein